jgi:FAD-dependent oxidoreductase family protein
MNKYDLVVIGGGLAGFCAAMAAARLGSRTALIQDRSVLGGNCSSEIRVPIGGACDFNPWARETGILEEFFLEERRQSSRRIWIGEITSIWDLALYQGCYENENLDLFLNTKVFDVEKDNNLISAVKCICIDKEDNIKVEGKFFLDATGDGVVAYKAGAETRFGREGRDEFNEELAPDIPDDLVMGSTLSFHAEDAGTAVPFALPSWAPVFKTDKDLLHRTHVDMKAGYWWIEIGNPPYHTIHDNDKIRDELYKQLLGVWDHIKNQDDHAADNLAIDFIGSVPGKRESRRIVGPYIMREDDVRTDKMFSDSVAYGGWFCDLHTMGGILNNEKPPEASFDGNLEEEDSRQMHIYSIPLRSLFSKDIDNLFMAGRDISVSHVALGTTRLMATCAVIGQGAGTAVAHCIKQGLMPNKLSESDIDEIQQQLIKDDCYIPGLINQDTGDLARTAKVSVSSSAPLVFPNTLMRGYEYEHPRQKTISRSSLDIPRLQLFPCTADFLEKVSVYIESDNSNVSTLTVSLVEANSINDFNLSNRLKVVEVPIEPNSSGWIDIDFNCSVKIKSLLWIKIVSERDVFWLYSHNLPTGTVSASRIIKNHRPQKGSYALKLYPQMYPYKAENLLSGLARPEIWTNIWISDPKEAFPACVGYELKQVEPVNTLYLTFDTNLTLAHVATPGLYVAPECVKDYNVYVYQKNKWIRIVSVKGNYQRRRIHRFEAVTVKKIKLEILATNGDPSARLYELRLYNEQ